MHGEPPAGETRRGLAGTPPARTESVVDLDAIYDLPVPPLFRPDEGAEWSVLGAAALGLLVLAVGLALAARARGRERRAAARIAELEAAIRGQRDAGDQAGNLGGLVRTVSHDLRSPLGAALNFAELLKEECGDGMDEVARDCVARVAQNARQACAMLDVLVQFADVATRPLQRTDCSPEESVRSAYLQIGGAGAAGGPELQIDPMPPTRADARMLEAAYRCLLEHAAACRGEGERPRLAVGGEARDEEWVLWVRDDGDGFDPARHDELFGMFGRGSSRERAGLALVERVARRHGGRAWAEAEPGGSSTLFFALGREAEGAP